MREAFALDYSFRAKESVFKKRKEMAFKSKNETKKNQPL